MDGATGEPRDNRHAKGAVALVDPHREGDWPASLPAATRAYVSALVDPGPEALCANARGVRAELLRVGETVVPVMISEGRRGTASFLAPSAHHVLYPVHEISRARGAVFRAALTAAFAPLVWTFRLGALDRVAIVNHWLLTGSPPLALDAADWRAVLDFVARRHPRHAVLVPDVMPERAPATAEALTAAGAVPVPWREVNVLDPDRPGDGDRSARTVKKHWREAAGVLRRAEERQIPAGTAAAQPARLHALYRSVYLGRHSRLNPDYTEPFFAHLAASPMFRMRAWADGSGTVEAFHVAFWSGVIQIWSAFGVDLPQSRHRRLYERIMANDVVEALGQGGIVHWGGGAAEFKRYRGAAPFRQVEFVRTAHLPARQRAAWWLLRRLREIRPPWRGRGGEA